MSTTPAHRRDDVLAALGLSASAWFTWVGVDVAGDTVHLRYDLDGVGPLVESFVFEGVDVEAQADRPDVRAALELLHLAAGVSYVKATLPPRLHVADVAFGPARRALLADLLTHGLAEFAHVNDVDLDGWFQLPDTAAGDPTPGPDLPTLDRGPLVPVGGGKDSVVTLEALRDHGPTLFAINPRGPIEATFDVAGMPATRVRRHLDEQLFDLNDRGALNGHVPVTAIVSAAAVVTAVLGRHDTVAMSNEASADQPTLVVDARPVNHQWSKSSAFERRFAALVADQVHPDLLYASFLRPASELAIARRFATLTAHHGTFNSCNRAFHLRGATTQWCGDCPKCRFVFLVLAPFMSPQQLVDIFGRDMLDDPTQTEGFGVLAAIGGHKPFECVGEAEESAAAIACLADRDEWRDHVVVRSLAAHTGTGCADLDRWVARADPGALPERLREAFRAGV